MIYQSQDVYAVLGKYMPIVVLITTMYTLWYCTAYALLFKVVGISAYKAFIPLYGQACLFSKFGLSPFLVLLPILPIVGVFYIFERIYLRWDIGERLNINVLLRILFVLFPTLSNIVVYTIWRSKHADIHETGGLGKVKKKNQKTR